MSHLKHALAYAARGLRVFPCQPGSKEPIFLEGYKLASGDTRQIAAWWAERPTANIGIACGTSRLVVIDLDGPQALALWLELYQPLVEAARRPGEPVPPIALTPRPGLHLYFRSPPDLDGEIPCSTGKLGRGIDVKSAGGHVIAPPSLHPNGGRYRWAPPFTHLATAWALAQGAHLAGEAPALPQPVGPDGAPVEGRGFPDLPAALVERLLVPRWRRKNGTAPRAVVATTYALAALLREADAVRTTLPGERNNRLFRAALRIGRFVVRGELAEEQFEAVLVAAGCDTGLDETEARQAVANGLAYAVTHQEETEHDATDHPHVAPRDTPGMAPAGLDTLAAGRPPEGVAGRLAEAPVPGALPARGGPHLAAIQVGGTVAQVLSYRPEEINALAFPATDTGHAQLFQARFGPGVCFDHSRQAWLLYDGVATWRDDDKHLVDNLIVECAHMIAEAAVALPAAIRKHYAGDAAKLENVGRITAALQRAASLPGLATITTEFDRHPHLLACRNGVVDLRDGRLRKGEPDWLLRNATGIDFDPHAECPRWERFLWETFGGDAELIDYLQRLVGYSLTGLTSEQIVLVCWGTGANGKSTLFNALHKVFGDYAAQAPETTFEPRTGLANTNNTNDLAGLAGKRLVMVSETAQDGRLNEARLKQMSGGDPIKARFLNCEYFTYTPQFTVWLATNHRPPLSPDGAIWRRVKLIPFTQSFLGREDRALGDKLAAEAAGILAWAVRGAVAYYAAGKLEDPCAVARATADYRAECDPFPRFVAECLLRKPGIDTTAKQLHERYLLWAEDEGAPVLDVREMGKQLRKAGFRSKHTRLGTVYADVVVRDTPT